MTEHSTLAAPRVTAAPAVIPGVFTPEPPIRQSAARRERLRKRVARRATAWVGLMLVGYWVLAFTATHMPMKGGGPGIPHLDKAVHLTIYTGLALLLSVWFGVRKRVGGAMFVAGAVLVALVAYATFDEVSQMAVAGRTADVRDWFADLAGIHLGLFGFFALRSWVRR